MNIYSLQGWLCVLSLFLKWCLQLISKWINQKEVNEQIIYSQRAWIHKMRRVGLLWYSYTGNSGEIIRLTLHREETWTGLGGHVDSFIVAFDFTRSLNVFWRQVHRNLFLHPQEHALKDLKVCILAHPNSGDTQYPLGRECESTNSEAMTKERSLSLTLK